MWQVLRLATSGCDKRLVHVSTLSVFQGAELWKLPVAEDTPITPNGLAHLSPYGASKRVALICKIPKHTPLVVGS